MSVPTKNIAEHEENKAWQSNLRAFNNDNSKGFATEGQGLLNDGHFMRRLENNQETEIKFSNGTTMTGKEIMEAKAELEEGINEANQMMGEILPQAFASLPPPLNAFGDMLSELFNSQSDQPKESLGMMNLFNKEEQAEDKTEDKNHFPVESEAR